MPLVQIDITEEEAARLDVFAAAHRRARKNEAAALLMERVAELEAEKAAESKTEEDAK